MQSKCSTFLSIFTAHSAVQRAMPAIIAVAKGIVSITFLQRSIFHQVHVADACEAHFADHEFLMWTTSGGVSGDGAPGHETVCSLCCFEWTCPQAESFTVGVCAN